MRENCEFGSVVVSAPVVSIITPAYNAAPWIGETARSVRAQTYAEWEWLVVDDGSTDATAAIVESFGDLRIRVIRQAHSGLPATARNRGIAEARGEYVAFLDADDVWRDDKLMRQMACFEERPAVGLVFSQCRHLVDGRLRKRSVPRLRGVSNPGRMFRQLCVENFVPNSTVVMKRALLDAHGMFDEDPRQRGTEDYELWLRVAPHVDFACVMEPLLSYRVRAGALSRDSVASTRGRILAVEKHATMPEAWKAHLIGVAQSTDGAGDCGTRAFLRAVRANPRSPRTWAALALSLMPRAVNVQVRRLVASLLS